MSDVPSDVWRAILLRLPAASLFPLRTVSKEWRLIIDHPSFVKAHTNNQLSSPDNNTLLIRNKTGAPLYLVNLESIDFTSDARHVVDAIPVKQLIRPGVPRLSDLPTTSCNGLILISSRDFKKIWAVWNPLTRECHQLPQPDDATGLGLLAGTGLGYDAASDDYKIVRIHFFCPDRVTKTHKMLVYSMRLGSWRRIRDCPYYFLSVTDGVFLNGSLHWESRDMIFVFDLGTEDYCQLALPPEPITRRNIFDIMRLDAIGGFLTMSYYYCMTHRFDIWIMEDYGVENSWVKLFSIRNFDIPSSPLGIRPVAYLKGKSQVLIQHDKGFIWFGGKDNSVRKVAVHGLSGLSSGQICPGSLLRLDDSGSIASNRTSGAKRKKAMKRKTVGTRLTFCVRDVDDQYCSDFSCCSVSSEGED